MGIVALERCLGTPEPAFVQREQQVWETSKKMISYFFVV